MNNVTKEMMKIWHMKKMDWMGYALEKREIFSYHHLRVAKRDGGPINIWNGAVLIQTAGHDYLHVIERYERKLFEDITKILIEINEQRFMPTRDQLLTIHSILESFEKLYSKERTSTGRLIVKDRYLRRFDDVESFRRNL